MRRTIFVSNTPKLLQTTLAANGLLAEGQFLKEQTKLNAYMSLKCRLGHRSLTLPKGKDITIANGNNIVTSSHSLRRNVQTGYEAHFSGHQGTFLGSGRPASS